VAERQELVEHGADAGEVLRDVVVAEQPPALVLAGRIADPGGAAAHQGDWPVPSLLEPVQQHDLHEAADVQRGRSAVESDIGGDRLAAAQQGVERIRLGHLLDEAAARQHVEKIGLEGGYPRLLVQSGQLLTMRSWVLCVPEYNALLSTKSDIAAHGQCKAIPE